MNRPCTCDRCATAPGAAYTPDQCRLCWLYHHDAEYRALWGGDPACRHRGEVIDLARCESCRGQVLIKVHACAVHGKCTLGKPIAGYACCANCPDRDPL
jgi:hypothetical protein